jgi:hypothetical protein
MSRCGRLRNGATERSGPNGSGGLDRGSADPGAATVAEIAAHWLVCTDTARLILAANGLVPVRTGPERYRWTEIWRFEGLSYVPVWDWSTCKAPLLKPADLVDDERRGWSARSVRRKLETGAIPSIHLTDDLRRIRPDIAERLRGYL